MLQDLRYGVRLLARDRWFTCAAVVALALGIGVNTTVFTIINGMNLRGLPVDQPEQIMALSTQDARGRVSGVSYPDFRDWQNTTRTFEGLAAFASGPVNIGDEGRPADRFGGSFMTANAFALLRVRPILGRDFRPEDDRAGAEPVVILAHAVWADRYGEDPAIIGRVIRVNGAPATVVGVMPRGFRFPITTDVWRPLALAPDVLAEQRDARNLGVFGRRAGNVTIEQARAELFATGAGLSAQYPDTNKDAQPRIVRYDRQFGSLTAAEPLILMGSVGFVLLISCANVASLLLARSHHRAREVSVRAALGASRGRIVRQLLVEAIVLAIIAGVIGLLLSLFGLRFFQAETVDLNLPYWMTFTFDAHVFGFLACVCLGTSLLFGLAPAWHLARTGVHDMLKDAGRSVAGSRRARRWTGGLVVAELALTLVLLAGAGLLVQSALALYRADQIVDFSNVLTANLSLPVTQYATPEQRHAFYRQLEDRLRAIQPVSSAAIASAAPFLGASSRYLSLDGDRETPSDTQRSVDTVAIGSRYFETLGLALLRGRAFADQDGASGFDAAIVNQRFVETYFSSGEAVGRRIRLTDRLPGARPGPWLTVIAVSPSIRQGLMSDVRPVVYLPLRAQPPASIKLMFRSKAETAVTVSLVRDEVRALDSDLPLYAVQPLERISETSRWPARVISFMLSVFGSIAMFLAAIGVYATTAYGVSQRTKEIGIRMALGAQRAQVSWLMLRGTLVQLAVGLAFGAAGALAVGRLLQVLLVDTLPSSPMTLAAIVIMLIAVTVTACLMPARRATRVDPVTALRQE